MKNNTKKVHERYHASTRKAKKVIKDKNFTYRLLLETINKYFPGGNKDILDIGCGAGTLAFYLANKGYQVTGIDISDKAVRECKKSAKYLNFKNVVFLQSEFPEKNSVKKKFDGAIFTEVIEHLENDTKALKEIYSILKDGGLLILSTPSTNAPMHKLGLTKEFDKRVGHLRRYSLKHLEKLLIENNFKILEKRKTEGIIRNFLFVNPYAGKLVRFLNYSSVLSDITTFLDDVVKNVFGESNYIITAKKI